MGYAAGHPLLAAHTARRRPALRLSEAVEPHGLSEGEGCSPMPTPGLAASSRSSRSHGEARRAISVLSGGDGRSEAAMPLAG